MADDSFEEQPGLFPMLHSLTKNKIGVQWTYVQDDDWMPVDHFLLEYNTTNDPKYIHVDLPPNQRLYVINDCPQGTKHSITLTSIDINGRAVTRAKPLIVETSAPIVKPVLKLLHNEPGCITVGWDRPREYGNAGIKEYALLVNGKDYAKIISTQTELTYPDCRALRTYTFRLQAISAIPNCDSDLSHILDVTCPGAIPITLERAHSSSKNKVKVSWNRPICQGGARVREYKIHYLKVEDPNEWPSKDRIIDPQESILHTLQPSAVEDSLKVEPDKYYWAILEAEIVPDGCPNLTTPSIKLHATIKPVAPEISIDIYGLKERVAFDKEMAYLVDKRDRLKKKIFATSKSVLSKGENIKDEEVQRKKVLLYRVEKRLDNLLEKINEYTGTVSAVVRLKTPNFDEFSEPTGYRLLVNNEIYAENLPLDTKQFCKKMSINELRYKISATTLSSHSVGHSPPSPTVEISSSEFRPVRFFCYFKSHNQHAKWPDSGCCRVEDTLEYERQYVKQGKDFPQRWFGGEHVHASSFHARGVFDGKVKRLGEHFGGGKPTALLFWTKWCASSKRAMEYYNAFARTCNQEIRFLTCCAFSEEPIEDHLSNVEKMMTNNEWNQDERVLHFCACHPAANAKLRKRDVENSSFAKIYELHGVPTLVLIDGEGYIAWQGRVFGDNTETFGNYLRHTFSVIEKSECPIRHCEHCDSERYGVLYSEKTKTTFTGKDLTIEQFNGMMAKQEEQLGEETSVLYLRDADGSGNPGITIGECDDDGSSVVTGGRGLSATSESMLSLVSHSPSLENQSLRRSLTASSAREGMGSTWSSAKFQDKRESVLQRSKSVGFREEPTTPATQSRKTNRVKSKTLPERRAASAMPNIGRRRAKVAVPTRPKTSTYRARNSEQYDWIKSQYSRDTYVPYNPYKGASYAKNGSIMSFYSRCGYIPKKPFPNDNGFPKVSWDSKNDVRKQKVPSHREIKYLRDGDWREK